MALLPVFSENFLTVNYDTSTRNFDWYNNAGQKFQTIYPTDPGYSQFAGTMGAKYLSAARRGKVIERDTKVIRQFDHAPRFSSEGQYAGVIAGRDAADAVFGEALLGVPEA